MAWASSLHGAAWLFVGSWVVHTLDHARRSLSASPEAVTWSGTMAALLAAVAVTLILSDHAIAPALALVVFPSLALGVTATHLLPNWGPLSDPILFESTTDGWSVLAVSGEILAAAWLGLVAFRIARRHNFARLISADTWGPGAGRNPAI